MCFDVDNHMYNLSFSDGERQCVYFKTVDKDSAIIIRTQANTHFVVRLLSGYTEEGFHIKTLIVENNNQTIAAMNFPSSENIKNFSVNIKKHKKDLYLNVFTVEVTICTVATFISNAIKTVCICIKL